MSRATYDITAYKADPTGGRDTTPSLNLAANDAIEGGTILFPPGVYLFSTPPVPFRGNIKVQGNGGPGSSLAAGTVFLVDYTESDPDLGFLTWNGASGEIGTGIESLVIFKRGNQSGGSAIVLTGSDSLHRAGWWHCRDVRIAGNGLWDRGLLIDGNAITDDGSMGIRDVFVENFSVFSCKRPNAYVEMRNAVHFTWTGGTVSQGGSTVPAGVLVSGGGGKNQSSQDIHLSGISVYGTTTFDQALQFTFIGTSSYVMVTPRASDGVVIAVGGQVPQIEGSNVRLL